MNRYQVIYLTLSDGRKIAAIVKEFCKAGDRLSLCPEIKVTEPREMPEGHYWTTLEEGKHIDVAPKI